MNVRSKVRMIDQTHLVQDVLIGDRECLEDYEIYHLDHIGDVDRWYAVEPKQAIEHLIEKKPTIVSHFGCWIGLDSEEKT